MTTPAPFAHEAFFYRSDDSYVAALVPYLREGLEGGEAVAVATAPHRISLLREALGRDAAAVVFLPDHEWYVRPVATIAGWVRMVTSAVARGRTYARLVGEVRFGTNERQHPGWVRCEAVVNRALADLPARLVCPYDERTLPKLLLDEGRRTHPGILNGRRRDNAGYLPPEELLALVPEPPYPVVGEPVIELPIERTVAGLRELVRERGTAAGWLPPNRLDDLVLALSEVATNGVRHGYGRRRLRVWVLDGAVVCEVTDEGPGPRDPLAGYLPPPPGATGGMGLWLVHQICDALSIDTSGGRTRVRFAVHAS